MKLVTQARAMAAAGQALAKQGRTVGFVPTMGALHGGHLSLIREAKRRNRAAVVSIFVNPLQFGPREDFARYPRNLARDVALAASAGADLVFAPPTSQMYAPGFCTTVEVAGLSDQLEGAQRPGHFRGVATAVLRLCELVRPTVAYFGQKDYQQTVIIRRMVHDLGCPVAIRVLPTVREPDGLAMSSRNAYLSDAQRRAAPAIYQALRQARQAIRRGARRAAPVRSRLRAAIERQPALRVQAIALVDAETLRPLASLRGRVAILVTVRAGRTRLIDNLLVDVP